jgi:hypothetical protein
MRLLMLLLIASPISAQVGLVPPTVRDAYSLSGSGKPLRVARLGGDLRVVVCKDEYDAWRAANSKADLMLYLDGILMKGAATSTAIANDVGPNDEVAKKIAGLCVASSPVVSAAEKAARDSDLAAKAALDAVGAEKDPAKLEAAKQNAAKLTETAQSAHKVAELTAQAATSTIALRFYLSPELVATGDPKDTSWHQFLERPWRSASVAVSVGPESGPWASTALVQFHRLNMGWLVGWAALFFVAIALFVRYARASDIIRDTGDLPSGAIGRKAFSLARTQMAIWTFLVGGALAFIFIVTWNENTITAGVLVLIGISSGTTLLAATADGPSPTPQVTQGFFSDLLTDGTGPSFHRYQMVLFTVILAVIFVVKVGSSLAMPDFDATLLALMGISNGTYLGFKLQGK